MSVAGGIWKMWRDAPGLKQRYTGTISADGKTIGVYPVGEAAKHKDLGKYMTGRGTYRFPLQEPMPMDLIRKLVEARIKKNEAATQKEGFVHPSSSAR